MAGAQTKNSTCFFLPDELVLKILTFLPVLSLLRCKSVCKTWLSIISNPQFTQTHLIQSRKKQPSSVLNVYDRSIYVDTCENSTLLYVLEFFNYGAIDTVCSCNGLVCVSNRRTDVIYLGNPVTRQFKKLPPPSELTYGAEFDDEFVLGFGFDDISSDYKILRISQVPVDDDDNVVDDDGYVIRAVRAEMYSANDDSWKQIHIPKTLEYTIPFAWVNPKGSRVLYFDCGPELLSFDLHNEVFKVYHYPQLVKYSMFVLDFEGSVALIFNESTDDKPVLSLWTLNEILGNWSRTKEFNLDDSSNTLQLTRLYTRLYLGDGQFFACGIGEYIFHDYKKMHVKKFLHQESMDWAKSITEYTETLISLKGFEQLK